MSLRWFGCFALLAVLAVGCGRNDPSTNTSDKPAPSVATVEAAQQAIAQGDWSTAGQLVQQLLITDQRNASVLEMAGDLAVQSSDAKQAVEFYQLAIDATDSASKELLDKLGREWMNLGRPFESIETLKLAVKQYPKDPDLRQKLVGLQSAMGMQRESARHLQWLVQRGHGGLNLLVILSDLNRPQTVEATCKYALKTYPADLRPQFSLASLDAYHSQWKKVAQQLKPVIARHPDFLPAVALYGRSIVELGDQSAINVWSAALPDGIESEPQYWLAAGIWSERMNDNEAAAKTFWEAARLNENDGESLNRLSAALASIGRDKESKAAAQRGAKIAALRGSVDSLISWKNNSQTDVVKIAATLEELGRRWEATTWLQAAFRMTQNKAPKLNETYESIRASLTAKTPWQDPAQLVAAKLELPRLADVAWQNEQSSQNSNAVAVSSANIRFDDQAKQHGLEHVCKLGKPAGQQSSLGIYQSGAGAAGVIDFDLDGWPDLYLTVIDGTPNREDSGPNRLHRNQAGSFVDVTPTAAVGDTGFSQGVAVGDYNADGFADLLVGNLGLSRLYRNNGDGTFSDATTEAGLSGEAWTTSVAIVDIDGDGHADLFQVGYCAGDKPLQQKCMDKELGESRSCPPLIFDPEPDQVWRGNGDGSFSNITDQWLTQHEQGRGLGLVVGNLDQQAGMDIYIANDMTANHYWSRDENAAGFRLIEQATVRGLAFNERSLAQASMGMAAGDADSDGDIDFLLTHFSLDHNTFYQQVSPGIWADRSNRVGLASPSYRMLGYGTQWIDADNDGSPELFVANGDIDDFSHLDRFFKQPAQLFARAGDGTWKELDKAPTGEYFTKDHLGRAVAKLDANRDGKTDLAVSHLFEPVALLINETETSANRIRIYLRGTTSHRDAIGTTVTLKLGDRKLTKQLLAGDGFQCSNERCLTFGVGDAKQVDDVTIHWPDGSVDQIEALSTNRDYIVVQHLPMQFSTTR